ncbi:carbamoyltransferase HypF [Corynebacterium poyangense]|uniref:Carbamoyltransferase n=1 Tax=Corynebacterium poyangense TaxID=2684405 RepID=A0A7H0SR53_9CORY|nr:carbamoyltransferase HypF [Corynebacterium poyangense]MBZ8176455.1 carbamoyltransferase HypF [Corynebacterium poyangense]QNQ91028.1 carbamoyltransferase HypF [Corynebacterium poyangense]
MGASDWVGLQLRLRGVVQGVGFRPHVARIAQEEQIVGECSNDDSGVFIRCFGPAPRVESFRHHLLTNLPPLAVIIDEEKSSLAVPTPVPTEFVILPSRHRPGARTLIPPDVATCPDCLAEMRDPQNCRYRYPFITCTNCGPRLSIIEDLPYDRPATTMRDFPLCPQCAQEYSDPQDRRYHAQPISCPDCGPRLWLENSSGVPVDLHRSTDEVLDHARGIIHEGGILAVKGLGGFHLLCDATNSEAVARLRTLKKRPAKPFALMVPDLSSARRICRVDRQTAELLESPAHPIVLVDMASDHGVAPEIAPGLHELGIMLPYTPIHHLLVDSPVVATSGNVGGEPICWDNDTARTALAPLCDAFLLHDRGIHLPVEDSVLRSAEGNTSPIPVRRARGYAPLPIPLPKDLGTGSTVLGVGGELKNTFALAVDDLAHISSHNGDMGSWAAQQAFERAVEQLTKMRGSTPDLVVCDLHPGYATTTWAERYCQDHDVPLLRLQHHVAHALSLVAEHHHRGAALVATLDGTGYGTDGTIWGGELIAVHEDRQQWERTPLVPEFPLVGGDRAVRFPWRILAGIRHAWNVDVALPPGVSVEEAALVESQLRTDQVRCTSLGRVLDAGAALLGLIQEQSFEGEAAMYLESLATRAAGDKDLLLNSRYPQVRSFPELFQLLVGLPKDAATASFFLHQVAKIISEPIIRTARRLNLQSVGLSGGCAINRILVTELTKKVSAAGLELYQHHIVPPNDGGISLGQVVAGRAALRASGLQ